LSEFLTLDDVDVKKKVVLLRVDINVPYDPQTDSISDSERLRAHAETVRELSDKSGRIVVLAHQGRKGEQDFIHLNQHTDFLSKHSNKEIKYVEDVIGKAAVGGIKNLREGEVLLLDNVRLLDDETVEKSIEEHANSKLVATLSPLADVFVNDAFSVAHRAHASIIGFTARLPSFAGRVMEREIKSCEKALNPERPNVFILGGAKPKDCVKILDHMLRRGILTEVLTCGLLGQLFLLANGEDLGQASIEVLKKKDAFDLVEKLRGLYTEYEVRIKIPLDVAEEVNDARVEREINELPCEGVIMDIGNRTTENYKEILKSAKTIIVKGPAGVYEKKEFELGTRNLLDEISKSKAFTLIGGGDTSVAVAKLGFKSDDFSYVSIAGGALITYLSGKDMPGVRALKEAAKR